MPQGYNTQSSYNAQQQRGLVYTAPRVGEYVSLKGYNSQKGYVGIEQSNTTTNWQGYTTKRRGNYGERGYLFSKIPEVGVFGGESFTTRRLNDLVGEEEKTVFMLPISEATNRVTSNYGVLPRYQSKRVEQGRSEVKEEERGKGKKEEDTQSTWNNEDTRWKNEDKILDSKKLAELIEQELRQFPAANQEVQYV